MDEDPTVWIGETNVNEFDDNIKDYLKTEKLVHSTQIPKKPTTTGYYPSMMTRPHKTPKEKDQQRKEIEVSESESESEATEDLKTLKTRDPTLSLGDRRKKLKKLIIKEVS